MAASPSQTDGGGGGPTPMKPHPPASTPPTAKIASPNTEREKRTAYLRRPEVASVMDDLVSQCLENMPDDPASFIIQHLETRTGSMSRAESTVSGTSGSFQRPERSQDVERGPANATPPAQPNLTTAPQSAGGAAEDLLQWLVDNSHHVASGNSSPLPLSAAASAHPLASEIQAIQQRLQIDIEATTITSDEIETSISITPIQREALVRSVTRATQALIAVGTNTARVLETMASSLADLAEADRCSVFMADTRRKTLSTVVDGKEISLPFGRGIAGAVAASGKSMRIDKAYEDPRFNPEVDLLVQYVTRSLLTLPMHVNGQLIAVVQLVNKQGGPHFTESDEQIINAFTKVAGVTIRSSMFYTETSRMAQQNETIAKINAELANSDLDEGKLIPIIVRGAKEIVGADRCAFFKVEDHGKTIVAHLEGVYARMKLSTQDGIVGWVARNRELVNITDAYRDERFNGEVDRASGYKTESLLCVPIFAARELVGIAQLVNKKDPTTGDSIPFDEHDEATITAFGKAAGVCMRNCKLHDDLVMQQARLEDVARIATHLSSTDSDFMKPKPILEFIAKVIKNSSDSGRCLFYQVGDQDVTPGLHLVASSDISACNQSVMSDESEGRSMGGPTVSSGTQSPAPNDGGIVHPIGSGVIGAHATRPRSSLITGGELAGLEMDAHYPDGARPDSVVVVPIIDSGMTIGCCVLVDPCPAVSDSIVAAGTVKRRSTMAAWKDLSSSGAERNIAAGTSGGRFAADISVGVSMAGFTMRMAHILEMASRHGNNLAAIMEFEQAGVEPNDQSTDEFTMATSTRTFAPVDEAELHEIAKLSFDIHKYRRGDAPAARLLAYIRQMMVSLNVMEPCAISDARLHRFLSAVRSKYRSVPYHNFFHAFDVTQTVFTLMRTAGLDKVLEADERFALLTACVCHDVDHMGLNNAFHLRAETPLGILTSVSGQKSVLEVHHCQIAMDLLTRTRLLADTPKDMRVRIQKIIINCILATDMAVHRDKTVEVEAELGQGKFDKTNEQHRQLVMMLLLKMADISNVVKSFDISRQWGIAVTEEFYQQGDRERRAGLEVTPMFDRERKVELAKGQIGFIKMLAVPFFTVAADAFPAFKPLVESAEANIGHWEKVLESTRDV